MDLRMGIYAQEFAIDEEALELLIRYVNSHPTVFTMGMAWGGLNGVTSGVSSRGCFGKRTGTGPSATWDGAGSARFIRQTVWTLTMWRNFRTTCGWSPYRACDNRGPSVIQNDILLLLHIRESTKNSTYEVSSHLSQK